MSKIDQLLDGASDKFTAAEILANQEFYEDAVSRLFYGLLFCARALLVTSNISSEDPEEIISAFSSEFIKKGIIDNEMGTLIKNARKMAQKADFSPSAVISEEKVRNMIEQAQLLLETVEDALSELEE